MTGTSCGLVNLTSSTSMKAWMSTKRSTISLIVLNSPEKIGFAPMSSRCRKSLGSRPLTLFLTPITYLTSLQISTVISTSWDRSKISWTACPRRRFPRTSTSGSSNRPTVAKEKEFLSLMTSQRFPSTSLVLFRGTSITHCSLMGLSQI